VVGVSLEGGDGVGALAVVCEGFRDALSDDERGGVYVTASEGAEVLAEAVADGLTVAK
jgi:nitrous oxidase accessory protein NosD